MHEIIIQICFVVAGMVTGCTDGFITTDNPYLSKQDLSPVYIYNAPKVVADHYHRTYKYPSVHKHPRPHVRLRARPRHYHHHVKPKVMIRPGHKSYNHKKSHKKPKIVIPPNLYKVDKHKKPKVKPRPVRRPKAKTKPKAKYKKRRRR